MTAQRRNAFYTTLIQRVIGARVSLGRPMTLAEKLLFGHMDPDRPGSEPRSLARGSSFCEIPFVDHVALQDATAQMALLQLCQLDRPTSTPGSIHCDHLIQARRGAAPDLADAISENAVVYDFLRSAGRRYGLDFWGPGTGIIHTVVSEVYAYPGALILGTDSHTPNAGGLGAIAIGVGGADAVDAMAGLPFETLWPRIIGVRLTGKLRGWSSPKDVILHLVGVLTTKGATNSIVEFFGPGVREIGVPGRMTICNMGAEYGATCSIFPYDRETFEHLHNIGRGDEAAFANIVSPFLRADPEVEESPESFFDRVIEIDLSSLEPQVSGPHSPDRIRPLSAFRTAELDGGIETISAVHIGSCTNSSMADLRIAAAVMVEGLNAGMTLKVPLFLTPGSRSILGQMADEGLLEIFERAGAVVTASACSACIGMWQREDVVSGTPNAIVSTFNRNFPGRNDGSNATLSYLVSPAAAAGFALTGTLRENPILSAGGELGETELEPPGTRDLGDSTLNVSRDGLESPPAELMQVELEIPEGSKRLARLAPFEPPMYTTGWSDTIPVLVRAFGQCTTDHISPAGRWLAFRGNLPNISENYCTGVANPNTGKTNDTINLVTRNRGTYHGVALEYKQQGIPWAFIGNQNVGEGSSREHAALEPRYLGCFLAVAVSFARIHRANLKKQGILVATFAFPEDRELFAEEGTSIKVNLDTFAPGQQLEARVQRAGKPVATIFLAHDYTEEQIRWWLAGSALNALRQRAEA